MLLSRNLEPVDTIYTEVWVHNGTVLTSAYPTCSHRMLYGSHIFSCLLLDHFVVLRGVFNFRNMGRLIVVESTWCGTRIGCELGIENIYFATVCLYATAYFALRFIGPQVLQNVHIIRIGKEPRTEVRLVFQLGTRYVY